jgi:hypothetical protein
MQDTGQAGQSVCERIGSLGDLSAECQLTSGLLCLSQCGFSQIGLTGVEQGLGMVEARAVCAEGLVHQLSYAPLRVICVCGQRVLSLGRCHLPQGTKGECQSRSLVSEEQDSAKRCQHLQ